MTNFKDTVQITFKESLNQLLGKLGEELDIPEHIYEDAVLKYERVGEWLDAEGSALRPYKPEVFPQGSMRLGTTVRPIDDEGEYDIDLVCHLTIKKESITQEDLKHKVGDRLKENDEIRKMLEESRRCWRLNYPRQFHMDVLPAIPNEEQPPTGILLTDTDLRLWQKSNPKAYADWFYERMRVMVVHQKEMIFKAEAATYKSMEEVPEWKVRTPLQRAVQILKRHRDIYFIDDHENCPVSIILTTLAAKAYNNQDNIVDAIIGMVRDMPKHIEVRNGKWWVENPVEPGENFADKWNEKPERRNAFLKWLAQVQVDFEAALNSDSLKKASDSLGTVLGMRDTNSAAKALGLATSTLPVVSKRGAPYVPPLGDTKHVLSLSVPIQPLYKARVSATVHMKSGKKLWPLSDRPVPKSVWLRFVVSTNTPAPYTVKWQVVNTGVEAQSAQQPRGDFYDSDAANGDGRWESTAYRGTHWVEAFIIKNGVCVARSERTYVKVR